MKTENKTKLELNLNQTQEPFESPLQKWIKNNCSKCTCYDKNPQAEGASVPPFHCDINSPEGIDRMFLCMTAEQVDRVGCVSTDPEEILQDASKMLDSLLRGESEATEKEESQPCASKIADLLFGGEKPEKEENPA